LARCWSVFRKADTLQAHLPSDLQAELRDYQREGYQWMVKRSAAGVGVCLADDMGLGKTVQAIAVLLREQEGGIQLVICPTSVTSNWHEQIGKFAPSLRPHYWEGKARSDKLDALSAGDVVLCSYRMLLQDHAILKAVNWRCIILDEAQFIKNPDSKTARAVFELNSEIRIATTGTPIENQPVRAVEHFSIHQSRSAWAAFRPSKSDSRCPSSAVKPAHANACDD
jgi:SNF2 family DNA or RNA helicase